MKITTFVFAAIVALLGSGAFAQFSDDEKEDRGMSFDRLDQNSDGVLEEGEVLDVQDDHDFEGVEFKTLDKNGDGEVSRQEWNDHFR